MFLSWDHTIPVKQLSLTHFWWRSEKFGVTGHHMVMDQNTNFHQSYFMKIQIIIQDNPTMITSKSFLTRIANPLVESTKNSDLVV